MPKPKNKAPGPEPERLKIDSDWKDAVKKAVNTPPPKDEDGRDTDEDRPDDAPGGSRTHTS